ncbi:MAG: cytochrome c biogenesis protein ResB [Nitrospiraceae bacterium]|nr:MAG: cytochrome c biogenesis protein ResB [Nitrospiraceae bacterium]
MTPGDVINKTYRFFKSVKLTASVIALLIFIYFLGLVLPQKWMFDNEELYVLWKDSSIISRVMDFIGFTDIYMSPLTIVLLILFFINLLVVTLNRVPVMLKRAYLTGELPSFAAAQLKQGKNVAVIASETDGAGLDERLKDFFKEKRWFFREGRGPATYIAVRNRLSPIGFLLFHFSFFLCLIGGLMITYTRFSGNLPLTEGQSFQGDVQQFRVITRDPKIFKRLSPLELYVERVQPVYDREVPTELVVGLQAKFGDDIQRTTLRINEPLHRGAMSVIVERIGVSPLFIVRGPSGKQIDAAYVSLNVLGGQEDVFQFDSDRRYSFNVKFFPDYVKEDGYESTRSIEMKNPAIRLVVGKDTKIIYSGTIRLGESADLGPFTVSFNDIRYWVEFLIVREYGKIPLIAGFIIAGIGLIMRLVFYQKRLRIAIEYEKDKPLLYLDGRSEYFKYSFEDEMAKLVEELEKFLTGKRKG